MHLTEVHMELDNTIQHNTRRLCLQNKYHWLLVVQN